MVAEKKRKDTNATAFFKKEWRLFLGGSGRDIHQALVSLAVRKGRRNYHLTPGKAL